MPDGSGTCAANHPTRWAVGARPIATKSIRGCGNERSHPSPGIPKPLDELDAQSANLGGHGGERTSETDSVVSVGATSAESPETEAEPDAAELARASAVLNRGGVRIMALEGGATIGLWSDLDGPEVRAAIRTFGSDGMPVRYLDGAGVPMRYKVRRVDGERVLAAMEQHPAEPWKVRDRMLNEMGWCLNGVPWAEWKAAGLNRLFQEQGVTGKPGRITAATVRHGERKTRGTEL